MNSHAPTHSRLGIFAKLCALPALCAFALFASPATASAAVTTQTLTILGGSGSVGDYAPNVEYYNPTTGQWQPTYLTGSHPWGYCSGTNSWINYKASNLSDPGAGPTTNDVLWFLYRVRFTVPADAVNPHMTFSLKADNFAQVAINGATAGGSTTYLNNTSMPNVITGSTDQVNADAVFSQNVHAGENVITINVGDFGGLNGFNFRIDLTMDSAEPLEIIPAKTDFIAPLITGPSNLTVEATGPDGAAVTFGASAVDDVDGAVSVVASPASGSIFPLGTTTVDLGASDAAGNIATSTFTVTVQDTTPPVLSLPVDITVEATSAAGAAVTFSAGATDAVGVVSTNYSAASGSTFALGVTTVAVSAADAAGNTTTGSFTVTVQDTTAPTITSVTPSISEIWPPNKKMVPVTVTVAATDAVGVASAKIISVTTNQPDRRTQWLITGPLAVSLLADREGDKQDRIYTITVEVTDAAGNVSTATTTVTVPHDQGKCDKDKDKDDHAKDGHDKSGKDKDGKDCDDKGKGSSSSDKGKH